MAESPNKGRRGSFVAVWEEHLDPNTGRKYYSNPTTGEVTWNCPPELGGEDTQPTAPTPECHEPWSAHWDASTKRWYFYNSDSQETRWEIPNGDDTSEAAEPQSVDKAQENQNSQEAWWETEAASRNRAPTMLPAGTKDEDSSSDEDKDEDDGNMPEYQAVRVAGKGAFGIVFEAKDKATGDVVAIKRILHKTGYKNRELKIMQKLNHHNCVKLYNSFLEEAQGANKKRTFLNLVMEFVPKTMDVVMKEPFWDNLIVRNVFVQLFMYQACRAVAHLHMKGITHRDVRPQNFLWNPETHEVKICDFGSAKSLEKGKQNVAYIGARYYRAPELLLGATEYTQAVDLWGLGCVMAELLLKKPLFLGPNQGGVLHEVLHVFGTPNPKELQAMKCLGTKVQLPETEPGSLEKLFGNVATKTAIDLLKRFLRYHPTSRITALEALAHPYFDELRRAGACCPDGAPLPPLSDWSKEEKAQISAWGLQRTLLPNNIPKKEAPQRSAEELGIVRRSTSKINVAREPSMPSIADESEPTPEDLKQDNKRLRNLVDALRDQVNDLLKERDELKAKLSKIKETFE